MKILKKNIYLGTKCLCKKYSNEITAIIGDMQVGHTVFDSTDIEKNVIFVKVGENDFRKAEDIYNETNGPLSFLITKEMLCNIDMPKYSTSPSCAGDIYVKDLNPLFNVSNNSKEKISLKELINTYFKENNSQNIIK